VSGGKYNKWIVILQEFDLNFMSTNSKKSLVFTELILELLCEGDVTYEESFQMNMFFLSLHKILGMETSMYISRL